MHSSTAYWMSGLSTTVSISLGMAFVAGRKRVPKPATGSTAFRTRFALALMVSFGVAPGGNGQDPATDLTTSLAGPAGKPPAIVRFTKSELIPCYHNVYGLLGTANTNMTQTE